MVIAEPHEFGAPRWKVVDSGATYEERSTADVVVDIAAMAVTSISGRHDSRYLGLPRQATDAELEQARAYAESPDRLFEARDGWHRHINGQPGDVAVIAIGAAKHGRKQSTQARCPFEMRWAARWPWLSQLDEHDRPTVFGLQQGYEVLSDRLMGALDVKVFRGYRSHFVDTKGNTRLPRQRLNHGRAWKKWTGCSSSMLQFHSKVQGSWFTASRPSPIRCSWRRFDERYAGMRDELLRHFEQFKQAVEAAFA